MPLRYLNPQRRAERAAGVLRPVAAITGVFLLLVVSTTPLFAVADMPAASRGTLAAVFAPGVERPAALEAVARAGGLIVREGSWGTVLIAHSDESGFAGRLRRAGAWLVLDPQSAAGCLITGRINTGA
jgi:hypothetical protein